MKILLKKTFLFLLPLLVWGILIIIIDPFNYFNVSKAIDNETKKINAKEINTLLYRMSDFYHNPSPNIILGDSRIGILPTDTIKHISGKYFKQLNTNAAKLNEIFELFYFANEQKKLENVIIGINFNMFNEYGYEDRVTSVKRVLRNPLLYIYSRNVAQASYYVLRAKITDKNISSIPPMTIDEFWNWNINVKTAHWYSKYKFPEQLYKNLINIDSFAIQNKISLTFVIVPHHQEFHNKLVQFGLEKEEARFKTIMGSLSARVIDYDFPNAITTHRPNFKDPIHTTKEIGALMAKEITNRDYKIGHCLTKGNK